MDKKLNILVEKNVGWSDLTPASVEFMDKLKELILEYCVTGVSLPLYNRVIIEVGVNNNSRPIFLQVAETEGEKNIIAELYKNQHRKDS